jgi:energy-coupling factor transporter ATP-binding protein EcfA2
VNVKLPTTRIPSTLPSSEARNDVVISAEHLTFAYEARGGDPVFQDASFEVSSGELLGVAGLSGAGKTTLGFILKGLIPHAIRGHFSGTVLVDGLDVRKEKIARIARAVGMLFQDLNAQIFHGTVREEVEFGLRNLGMDPALATPAMVTMNVDHLAGQNPMNLSAGQKQRVLLASVIAPQPRILILDEPTAHLDRPSRELLADWLRILNEQDETILIIDQNPDLIGTICDQILLVKDRKITRVNKEEVLEHDEDSWKWRFEA